MQCWHLNILTVDIHLHKTFVKEAFDKIQHPVILKVLQRLGIQGIYLNKTKALYSKLIDIIKLNGEKQFDSETLTVSLNYRAYS